MSREGSTIYLDFNATTPVDPRVLEVMLPFFTEHFGNAASKTHRFGWAAEGAVKKARAQVAALAGCAEQEIIFTSGATEAINLAILGIWENYSIKGRHFIAASTEHKAVLDTYKYLATKGANITILPVNKEGIIDTGELKASIRDQTVLVSIMFANNETGVLQPLKEISRIVHEKGSLLLSDTTQAFGKIPVNVDDYGIDLCCLSAHKMYGPKGIGALYVRRKSPRVSLSALIHGGGHERGLRSGTLNVPGIAGMGKACEIAMQEISGHIPNIEKLRDELENELLRIKNASVRAKTQSRLPNTSNICLSSVKAERLISALPGLALATGSACTSAIPEPSHVLMAMGLTEEEAHSSIRISLGRTTSQEEARTAARLICNFAS